MKTIQINFMGFSLYTIYEFGKLMWDSLWLVFFWSSWSAVRYPSLHYCESKIFKPNFKLQIPIKTSSTNFPKKNYQAEHTNIRKFFQSKSTFIDSVQYYVKIYKIEIKSVYTLNIYATQTLVKKISKKNFCYRKVFSLRT